LLINSSMRFVKKILTPHLTGFSNMNACGTKPGGFP